MVQDPTENKDSYCESDLPCPRRLRTQPNQGQRQRSHNTDCDDNKGFSEIPLNLFLCKAWVVGRIHKLTAVFTLYRFVLNFFSAEGTLFHYYLFWQNNVCSLYKTANIDCLFLCKKLPNLLFRTHSGSWKPFKPLQSPSTSLSLNNAST